MQQGDGDGLEQPWELIHHHRQAPLLLATRYKIAKRKKIYHTGSLPSSHRSSGLPTLLSRACDALNSPQMTPHQNHRDLQQCLMPPLKNFVFAQEVRKDHGLYC